MNQPTEFTLNSLITALGSHTKQAAEDDSKKEDGKGKDGDGKKEEGKSGDAADKKDGDKDDKEGKDGKKGDQEKSASDLEKEILEQLNKSASTTTNQTKGELQMNKSASAQELGKALAQQLIKSAGVGDVNTTNGVTPGTVPNKVTQDNAAMVAQQDMVIQALPGTDGAGNGGTVNQIFDAMKAEGFARGAVNQSSNGDTAPAEGAQNATQAPAQVAVDESREKMAALQALVNSGIEFDHAVDLVKSASAELEQEEDTQIKQAAMNELIGQGVDFDLAVKLIAQFDKQ